MRFPLRTCAAAWLVASAIGQQDPADLLASLHDGSVRERVAALRRLAGQPPTPGIVRAVAGCLADGARSVRQTAATTLLQLRPDLRPAAERLFAAMNPPDGRWNARVGLAPAVTPQQLAALVADLDHADPGRRITAITHLCQLPDQAATHQERIVHRLADAEADVRAAVAAGAGSLPWRRNLREALLAASADPVPRVRQLAAAALARAGDDAAVVAALRSLGRDPDEHVRATALRSLVACTLDHRGSLPDLHAAVRDPGPLVRVIALRALAHLDPNGPESVRAVLAGLQDPEPTVLVAALTACGQLGPGATAAFARTLECTNHGTALVRAAAMHPILAIAPEEHQGTAMLRVVEALLDRDAEVAEAAALALRPPSVSRR